MENPEFTITAGLVAQLTAARNKIRNKLISMDLATSEDQLDALAAAIESIVARGAVSIVLKEGESYTIPAGYHTGGGTVAAVAGGGNYALQSKQVTPTKSVQNITSDEGYYGLESVRVAAIPSQYQDVSGVTASASDVLVGSIIVLPDGSLVPGTMDNRGAVSKTLDVVTVEYTIPKGFHDGNGSVKIVLEEKNVTPTKSTQTITPSSGKVLGKVTVAPIPEKYNDTSGVTATADKILTGYSAVDASGQRVDGSIPDNGTLSLELDGMQTDSVDIPSGYTSGGTVTLTDSIARALAAI